MAAPRGRPPGSGKVPGSGRKKGGLDRSARLLISESIAADILKTYKRLGPDWLFKVATERPDLFINQCLSRLLPPAFKEDGESGGTYNQFNIGGDMTAREAAIRISFALARGLHGDPSLTVEYEPVAEIVPRQADAEFEERRKELLS